MKLVHTAGLFLLMAIGTPALLPAQSWKDLIGGIPKPRGGWGGAAKDWAIKEAERRQREAFEAARIKKEELERIAREEEEKLKIKLAAQLLHSQGNSLNPGSTGTAAVPVVSVETPLQTNEATMLVFKQPMQFLEGRTARIVADTRNPAGADYSLLGLRLEQALHEGFTVEKGPADLVFTFAVVDFRRPVGKEVNRMEVRVHRNYSGNLVNGPVPVSYYEASGAINLALTVRNANGTTLASHTAKSEVAVKIERSVNRVAVRKALSPPSNADLFESLIAQCMEKVAKEFVPTTRKEAVRLAVNSEFREGYELARANEWTRAVASWKNAKTNNETDRALNLGVGNEALAYQALFSSRNLQEAKPFLDEATAQYERFLQKRPGMFGDKEGPITLRKRLAETKAIFGRFEEREELEKRRLARVDSQEAKPMVQPPTGNPVMESDFRLSVRARFQAASPSEAAQTAAQGRGVRMYQLEADTARRIVAEEAQEAANRPVRQAEYRELFTDLAADGRVEAEERAALGRLSTRLQLSEKEVAVIEAAFKPGLQSPTSPNATNRPVIR